MTEQNKQNKISGLVTAIVSKVTSLISIHDNDNNSHSDIRNSIPNPSTSNPSADTQSGSVGSSANYAKADHTHPKSNLYISTSSTSGIVKNDGTIDTTLISRVSALENELEYLEDDLLA